MEKYSDTLRRLANMLEDDFKGNTGKVIVELISVLASLSKVKEAA